MIAAGIVAGAVAMNVLSVLVVPVLFVLVVPFEKLFPRHRQRVRRPAVGTDIAYAVAQPLMVVAGTAVAVTVAVASLAWLPGLAVRPLVSMLPSTPRLVLGVVLFDMVSYWAHRWSHEVPFLWRFHAVHHSTEHLDWISGFRSHPFDGALVAPPFIFLLAAGFSAEFAGALAIIQLVTGLFLHANVRWRLRPLQRVVATPEFHHWHHADEAEAHNTNYAILLPVWDVLFGSYRVPNDRRPQVYGVGGSVPPGLVAQLIHPLAGLHRPQWIVRHPVAELRHLRRAVPRGVRQVIACSRRRRPAAAGTGS